LCEPPKNGGGGGASHDSRPSHSSKKGRLLSSLTKTHPAQGPEYGQKGRMAQGGSSSQDTFLLSLSGRKKIIVGTAKDKVWSVEGKLVIDFLKRERSKPMPKEKGKIVEAGTSSEGKGKK